MILYEVIQVYQHNQAFKIIKNNEVVIDKTSKMEISLFRKDLLNIFNKCCNDNVKHLSIDDAYCLVITLEDAQ